MRSFKVINNYGQAYDLMDKSHFLHGVSGLGFTDNTYLLRVGSIKKALTEDVFPQEPKGEIFFPEPNSYEKYHEFAGFLRNTPLQLIYDPYGVEYTLPVRVQKIDKTEILTGHVGLACQVVFAPLEPYYVKKYEINDGSIADGKVYNYSYDYTYTNTVAQTVVFDVDSHLDSPTQIIIYGPVENPRWTHYVNNRLTASGQVNVNIPSGHKLIVDCTQVPFSIVEIENDGTFVANRYQQSDFSTDRFIFLQFGQNRISVAQDGVDTVVLAVEARISYETV